jgi:translation initiation factor IF-2
MRFHELARQLGVNPIELKNRLVEAGVAVPATAGRAVSEGLILRARQLFGKEAVAVEEKPRVKREVPAAEVVEVAPLPAEAPPDVVAAAVIEKEPVLVEQHPSEPVPIEVRPITAPSRAKPAPQRISIPLPALPTAPVEERPEERRRRVAFSIQPGVATRRPPSRRPARRAARRPPKRVVKEEQAPAPPPSEPVVIQGSTNVRDLAARMGTDSAKVLGALLKMGVPADINRVLDAETCERLAQELGRTVQFAQPEGGEAPSAPEEGSLQPRPPVVTVLGHVDHGKTTLLDAVRQTNVTEQETGGITQHIGASQVEVGGRKITFLDTPGHEAFTAMRARGAKVTDVAVLVVAADDGVMPQTVEAINHARAAGVPIVVALNKIDLPQAVPDRVMQQLSELGLTPEEWGGDTVVVQISAKQRQGLDHLLDMLLLVADLQGLRADLRAPASGAIVEAKLDRLRGPVATVLVQRGTLRPGDPVVAGLASGRVRTMTNQLGQQLEEGPPSTPVEITGLEAVPQAGDLLEVVYDEKLAGKVAEAREARLRETETRAAPRVTLQQMSEQIRAGELKDLKLILKADAQGSVEAISKALTEQKHPEVQTKILHAGVGDVSESDVMLASASGAIIFAFQVRADANVRRIAEEQGVEIRRHDIIYDVIDDVRSCILGLLEPVYEELILGRAEVRALFKITKVGTIAGCYVTQGTVQRGERARVLRDGEIVFDGAVDSLRHLKDDVRSAATGQECGIGVEGFEEFQVGDIIETYRLVEKRRTQWEEAQ